jgi:bcr-type benzoyl-CoA reductase subunit C
VKTQQLLDKFHEIASNPMKQKDAYIAKGRKVVLTAPVYTPEEIVHAMGLVPMGVWGADIPLEKSKEYFPTFICSIMQSILELGMKGVYEGASALIVPSLCDSLKCLGQNWKYAVPSISFIPMTYPQNRSNDVGKAFSKAGYERVIADLEKNTGAKFNNQVLAESIEIYNQHNSVMRQMDAVLSEHSEILAGQRSDIYKSAFFMRKEEHTELVLQLLSAIRENQPGKEKIRVMTTGILCDSPSLLKIFDDLEFHITCDDVAAESRQYRTDAPVEGDALDALSQKFAHMDHCSVLYDVKKKRADLIVSTAQKRGVKGVVVLLTKFCDPEEFDFPIIRKACEAAGMPIVLIEVDRQMDNYAQARTALEAFRDIVAV